MKGRMEDYQGISLAIYLFANHDFVSHHDFENQFKKNLNENKKMLWTSITDATISATTKYLQTDRHIIPP